MFKTTTAPSTPINVGENSTIDPSSRMENGHSSNETTSLLWSPQGVRKKQIVLEKNAMRNIKVLCYGLIIFELGKVLLYGVFNNETSGEIYSDDAQARTDLTVIYYRFTSVMVMILLGFAYNSVQSSDGAISNIGFTLLLTTVVIQFAVLTNSFFQSCVDGIGGYTGSLSYDIYNLQDSSFAAFAIVISSSSFGSSLAPVQMLIVALIQTIAYSILNKYLLSFLDLYDPGQIYGVHLFSATYALSFSWFIRSSRFKFDSIKEVDPSVVFLGTIFLYIFWPNFVSGHYTANSNQSQFGYVNTFTCITASTVTSFTAAFLIDNETKISTYDIRNAIVSGGIAIGGIATLRIGSYIVIIIGILASFISIATHTKLSPYLLREYHVFDASGVLGTHGMCGLFGSIVSVLVAAYKASVDSTDVSEYGNSYASQWWRQLVAIFLVIGVSFFFGCVTGMVHNISVKLINKEMEIDDDSIPENSKDGLYWLKLSETAKKLYHRD
jgi:ammonium transporter Rh